MNKAQRELNRMKAELVKAAAHPIRIAGRPNVSRHLALMTRAGLLDSRKEGLRVYYRLRTPCILDFLGCVDRCLKEQLTITRAALGRL